MVQYSLACPTALIIDAIRFSIWPSPTCISPGSSASKRANIFSFKTSHFFRSCIRGMTPQATDHGSDVVCVRRRRMGLIVSAVLVAGIVAVVVAFAGKVNIYIVFSVEKGDRKLAESGISGGTYLTLFP